MIGVINGKKFFDFRTEEELLYAINYYITKKGYSSWAILNSNREPIAICLDNKWIKAPILLQEDTYYRIYANSENDYTKNLIEINDIDYGFFYTMSKIPKTII